MHDGITYARKQLDTADEAVLLLSSATRRWENDADAARSTWDDSASQAVFQRFLEPQRVVLSSAGQLLTTATEVQRGAIENATVAADAAVAAADDVSQSMASARQACALAGTARSETSTAAGEVQRTLSLIEGVRDKLGQLGGR